MKRIAISVLIFLAAISTTAAAATMDRPESVPDANPACMDRNGPNCVLPSDPSRTAPQEGVVTVPPAPPPIIIPPGVPFEVAQAPPTTIAPAIPATAEKNRLSAGTILLIILVLALVGVIAFISRRA